MYLGLWSWGDRASTRLGWNCTSRPPNLEDIGRSKESWRSNGIITFKEKGEFTRINCWKGKKESRRRRRCQGAGVTEQWRSKSHLERRSPRMSSASNCTDTSSCWAMAADRRPVIVLQTEAARVWVVRGSSLITVFRPIEEMSRN